MYAARGLVNTATRISQVSSHITRRNMASITSFKLNTGASIPAVGFGTWQDKDAQEKAVTEALNAGYRHIDTVGFIFFRKPALCSIAEFISRLESTGQNLQLARLFRSLASLVQSFSSPQSYGTIVTPLRMSRRLLTHPSKTSDWITLISTWCIGHQPLSLVTISCPRLTERCKLPISPTSIPTKLWRNSSKLARRRLSEFRTFLERRSRPCWKKLRLFQQHISWNFILVRLCPLLSRSNFAPFGTFGASDAASSLIIHLLFPVLPPLNMTILITRLCLIGLQQKDFVDFNKSKGIHITQYSPFGNQNEIYDSGKNISKLMVF